MGNVSAGPGRTPRYGEKLVSVHVRLLPALVKLIEVEAYEARESVSHVARRRLAASYGIALPKEDASN